MTRRLSDAALAHLRGLEGAPDFGTTRYRLLGTLGAGGMGSVYLAEDRDLERPVAIKVLHARLGDPQLAARLGQEARILAQLEHPGIVPVHAVGTLPDGRIYYVMKRVRGTRLDEAVAGGLALDARLGIFQRMCEAVAFAHAAGVVHRDLKPENVMVGPFGEVLVLDWGVAKRLGEIDTRPTELADIEVRPTGPDDIEVRATALDDIEVRATHLDMPVAAAAAVEAAAFDPARTDPSAPRAQVHASEAAVSDADTTDPTGVRTQHGTLLGTPAYMAPEQRRGEVERIDARTDVWALGAVLHFLLTGRAPVCEEGAGGVFQVVPPRRWEAGVPRALQAVCLRAMAAAPSERYARVEDLREEVVRYQAGQRVRADHENRARQLARLASRYRVPLVVLLAYLVVRAVLLVAFRR